MRISLSKRTYAVLIPSKGRPDQLARTLEKQPFLNRETTYIAVQNDERKAYAQVRHHNPQIRWVLFDNPIGSGCVARETLRAVATADGYGRYVPTDDNARYT